MDIVSIYFLLLLKTKDFLELPWREGYGDHEDVVFELLQAVVQQLFL